MNKQQCLRRIVGNLSAKRPPSPNISMDDIGALKFYRAAFAETGEFVGIGAAGGEAFERFAELSFRASPTYQRGTTFKALSDQLFGHIVQNYLGRDPESINAADVAAIDEAVNAWFHVAAKTQMMFVPCAITSFPGPIFSIGPIFFQHGSAFKLSQGAENRNWRQHDFGKLYELMEKTGAHWVATVQISDCHPSRAWELGELAVDLALAGLQLILPDAEHISRMNARTVPQLQVRIADLGASWSNHAPGLALGPGALAMYFSQNAQIINSVGNRIKSFLNRGEDLPQLNSAWSDAAYCFTKA